MYAYIDIHMPLYLSGYLSICWCIYMYARLRMNSGCGYVFLLGWRMYTHSLVAWVWPFTEMEYLLHRQ